MKTETMKAKISEVTVENRFLFPIPSYFSFPFSSFIV